MAGVRSGKSSGCVLMDMINMDSIYRWKVRLSLTESIDGSYSSVKE